VEASNRHASDSKSRRIMACAQWPSSLGSPSLPRLRTLRFFAGCRVLSVRFLVNITVRSRLCLLACCFSYPNTPSKSTLRLFTSNPSLDSFFFVRRVHYSTPINLQVRSYSPPRAIDVYAYAYFHLADALLHSPALLPFQLVYNIIVSLFSPPCAELLSNKLLHDCLCRSGFVVSTFGQPPAIGILHSSTTLPIFSFVRCAARFSRRKALPSSLHFTCSSVRRSFASVSSSLLTRLHFALS